MSAVIIQMSDYRPLVRKPRAKSLMDKILGAPPTFEPDSALGKMCRDAGIENYEANELIARGLADDPKGAA